MNTEFELFDKNEKQEGFNPFKLFPSYQSTSSILEDWYSKRQKKLPNLLFKIVWFIFCEIIVFFIFCIVAMFYYVLVSSFQKQSEKAYRNSDKYKKVIKEGFWGITVEYHEKEK